MLILKLNKVRDDRHVEVRCHNVNTGIRAAVKKLGIKRTATLNIRQISEDLYTVVVGTHRRLSADNMYLVRVGQ